jgi:hypothetical protein
MIRLISGGAPHCNHKVSKFIIDFRWVWVYKTSDYSYQLLFTNLREEDT